MPISQIELTKSHVISMRAEFYLHLAKKTGAEKKSRMRVNISISYLSLLLEFNLTMAFVPKTRPISLTATCIALSTVVSL